MKSDFSYDTYGTVPSIELNCDVKFGLNTKQYNTVRYFTVLYRIKDISSGKAIVRIRN